MKRTTHHDDLDPGPPGYILVLLLLGILLILIAALFTPLLMLL